MNIELLAKDFLTSIFLVIIIGHPLYNFSIESTKLFLEFVLICTSTYDAYITSLPKGAIGTYVLSGLHFLQSMSEAIVLFFELVFLKSLANIPLCIAHQSILLLVAITKSS